VGVRLKIIFECCEIKKSKRQKDETTKRQKTKKDWRAMKKYLSDLFAGGGWWMRKCQEGDEKILGLIQKTVTVGYLQRHWQCSAVQCSAVQCSAVEWSEV
jgi:hypothetical protein